MDIVLSADPIDMRFVMKIEDPWNRILEGGRDPLTGTSTIEGLSVPWKTIVIEICSNC